MARQSARYFRRFWRNRDGAGAVEFAMLTPLLLILYVGGMELTVGLTLNRKVKQVAVTVGDLVSQDRNVSMTDLDDILKISSSFLQPYPADPFGVRITGLAIDAAGQATVAWSRALGKISADNIGITVPLPAKLAHLKSAFLVQTETSYRYLPTGGYGLSKPFELGGASYTSPRIGNTVSCSDCS